MKKLLTCSAIIAALFNAEPASFAQNINFATLGAAPLAINPAFTGMFNGVVRANIGYESRWASVTNGYVNACANVDLPVYTFKNQSYLAAGTCVIKNRIGDHNSDNSLSTASVAYHVHFNGKDSTANSGSDLSFGIQAGFGQQQLDLSKSYFTPGIPSQYNLGLGTAWNYYTVNAGISYSHAAGKELNYTIGIAGYNLNQTGNIFEKPVKDRRPERQMIASAGADWRATKRLSLRPMLLLQHSADFTTVLAGNEFQYITSRDVARKTSPTYFFVGAWYSDKQQTMLTAGAGFGSFRIGAGYGYSVASLNSSSSGDGAAQLSVRYITHTNKLTGTKRNIPCARF